MPVSCFYFCFLLAFSSPQSRDVSFQLGLVMRKIMHHSYMHNYNYMQPNITRSIIACVIIIICSQIICIIDWVYEFLRSFYDDNW